MLILLFKENGPENSIILYNDLAAISKPGQILPFDCIENQMRNGESPHCSFCISGDCFTSLPLSTKLDSLGTTFLAADSGPVASPASGVPREGH